MTSVDKAAIAWSIAIIAVGIGFSVAGLSFAQVNSTTTSVSHDIPISIISSFEYEIIHSDALSRSSDLKTFISTILS